MKLACKLMDQEKKANPYTYHQNWSTKIPYIFFKKKTYVINNGMHAISSEYIPPLYNKIKIFIKKFRR